MYCFFAQKFVDRNAVELRKLLDFVDPRLSLPLFDRNNRGAGDAKPLGDLGLLELFGLARDAQTFTDLLRRQMFKQRHEVAPAQLPTNELGPSDFINAFHSFSCCSRSRLSFPRASPGV